MSTFSRQYVTYPLVCMTQCRMPALFFCCRNKCWCEKQDIEGPLHWALCLKRGIFSPNYWPLLSQKVDMSNHRQKAHPCWSEKALHTLGSWESSALCNSLDDTLECSRHQYLLGTCLRVFLKPLLNLQCCQHQTHHRMFVEPNKENTMQPCQYIWMTACNFWSIWGWGVALLSLSSCISCRYASLSIWVFLSKQDWQQARPVQCGQSDPCIWCNPWNKFHISHLFLLFPFLNHIGCYIVLPAPAVFSHATLQPRNDWGHLGQIILKI